MGKIGIILAFLISIVAAAGSYYLYQGWVEERTVRGAVEARYDQVKEKMIQVQAEKDQIKAEKEKISARSEEYRTKAEAMQAQVGELQAEQSRIDSEKATLEKQLKSHQEMITELKAQMEVLEKKAKEAQAACGVTPADLKTDPFSTAAAGTSPLVFKPVISAGSSASLNAPVAAMPTAASVKPLSAEVASAGQTTASAVSPAATPVAAATVPSQSSEVSAMAAPTGPKVLTVNRKFNFVVTNQGLQDGFKMGDKLKVFKQGKEIATVQIEKLYDRFSAATLISEDPKLQVVEGDEIRKP